MMMMKDRIEKSNRKLLERLEKLFCAEPKISATRRVLVKETVHDGLFSWLVMGSSRTYATVEVSPEEQETRRRSYWQNKIDYLASMTDIIDTPEAQALMARLVAKRDAKGQDG